MKNFALKIILRLAILTLVIPPAFFFLLFNFAKAAEVAIDSSIDTALTSHNGSSPTVVFISDQVGYAFYRDSAGSCAYSKTADGGGAWGAAVTIDAQTDCLKIAVWYDRWTPGDTTGAYIHIVTMDTADLWYTRLNTAGDTLTTTVNASGANQAGGFAVGANIPSITKGTDGDLYMGAQDTADSFVIKCLTSADCTQAANWTEAGANPFDLATDWLILMPLSGGNILAIRWDISADDVQSKVYNDSANSWDASWATVDLNAIGDSTYDAHFGATIKRSTGDIYLAYAADVATFGTNDDIRAAVYSSGAWTSKTDVLTNDAKGITGVKISFDEGNNQIYAVYTARTTAGTAATGNVYWKKSTDGMVSWGAEQGPVNTTAGDLYGARVNAISDERIYVTWDVAAADDLMGNTVVDLSPPDTTAPAAVSNLAASSPSNSAITLSWTSPGDDGSSGTATSYDIRYSTSAITSGNFSSATAVTGAPTPLVAGTSQSKTVTGLSPSTTYYFAMKTSDEVPNTSSISNVPSLATTATPDTTAPAAVSNLAASSPSNSAITLSWTSPGDDGSSGTATSYDIRYSTSAITSGNFSSATAVTGEPIPSVAGTGESMTITGLLAGTTYYFALKTSDEVPNASAISNVPSLATTAAESASSGAAAPAGSVRQLVRTVTFSGRAYPGSTMELLRKSNVEELYQQVPVENFTLSKDGDFVISHTGLFETEYFFGLRVKDKDGREPGLLAFDLTLYAQYAATYILVPPTVGFLDGFVSRGQDIKIEGYASPNNQVAVDIDGRMMGQARAGQDGYYTFATSSLGLAAGTHYARARQIDQSWPPRFPEKNYTSAFSTVRAFKLSTLAFPKADFNQDGKMDIIDWSIFLFNWNSKNEKLRAAVDLNNDKKIDVADFSVFLKAINLK